MNATAIRDNRALLSTVGHRLVHVVAAENSAYGDALLAVVSERQRGWGKAEWEAALDELFRSPLTVSAWLAKESR